MLGTVLAHSALEDQVAKGHALLKDPAVAESQARSYKSCESLEAMLKAGVGRTSSLGWKPDLYLQQELLWMAGMYWDHLENLNLPIPGLLRCVGGCAIVGWAWRRGTVMGACRTGPEC